MPVAGRLSIDQKFGENEAPFFFRSSKGEKTNSPNFWMVEKNLKINMTIEKQQFQDVSPVRNRDFRCIMLVYRRITWFLKKLPPLCCLKELEIIQVKANDLTQVSKTLRLFNNG